MGFALFIQTSQETLQYRITDIIPTCSNMLRLFHALPTKDDGTQLHQISHTWPIASKNTLFSLIEPGKRKDKTPPMICCLEVAIEQNILPKYFQAFDEDPVSDGLKNKITGRLWRFLGQTWKVKMSFPDLSNIPQVGQKREGILHLKAILVGNPESATGGKKLAFENILAIKGKN